jgi:hypothetical protein
MPDFTYDIFISYSSPDRPWAERLYADLTAKGAKVFFDRERLDAGLPWKQELLSAVKGSRHLVVLWSEHAEGSQWVSAELSYFTANADRDGVGMPSDRRMIQVLLRGENTVYADLQAIDLRSSGYPDTMPEDPEWSRVGARIADAALLDESTVLIPLLLMTTTAQDVVRMDPAKGRLGGPTLEKLLADVNIAGETISEHYGDRRTDWRPFGANVRIQDTLTMLADELNSEMANAGSRPAGRRGVRRLRWEYVDEEFWSSEAGATRVTRRLSHGPAVVVVDPVSFYDESVFDYYSAFAPDILRNPRASVIVLSPFPTAEASVALRNALTSLARQIYKHCYNPLTLIGSSHARCGMGVGDATELAGWLASSVGQHVEPQADAGNEYFGHPAR